MGIDPYPAPIYPVNTSSTYIKKILREKKTKRILQMFVLPAEL